METRIWHEAYMPDVPPRIDYEDITMPRALERTARKYPENIALIMMGKKISYSRLNNEVDRLAAALNHLGIQKGNHVALVLPNIPQMVVATYALFKLGAVAVMLNPLYTKRELKGYLEDSKAKMVICLDIFVPKINEIKPETGVEAIIACHFNDYLPFPLKQIFPLVKKEMYRKTRPGEGVVDLRDLMKKDLPRVKGVQVAFEDLAALIYTGGTTGISKAVMLTHGNASCSVQQFKSWLFDAREGNERLLAMLPFFHVAGFTDIMNQCIYRGWTGILVPRPDADSVLKTTKKYRPTIFGAVPTLYVGLLNHPEFPKADLSFLKGCLSGAAPMAMDTMRQWEKAVGAPVVELYGLSETSAICHFNPWGGKTKVGSVGVPVPDTDCRIVDIETGTKELALGESGEILIKGPQVTNGYYEKPEETAQTIRDGWLHTGDIGYMDPEGYLFIVDRKKDVIIAGGYNIYPREVDEVLFEHPDIREAGVVGIPDDYRGQTVKAFVVKKPGSTLTREEIIAHCRENLAAYKVPRIIEFMDELPKSNVGKILKKELRE